MEIMAGKIRDLQDRFMSSNRSTLVLGGEKETDGGGRVKFFFLHFCFGVSQSKKQSWKSWQER